MIINVHTPRTFRHVTSLVALSLLTLVGCKSGEEQAKAENAEEAGSADKNVQLQGTRVEVAVVKPSKSGLTMRVPGEVEGIRDALLSSAMGGYIEQVAVVEGDEVKKGAVLARVDSSSHGARLVRAQVEKKAAERELARAKSLGDAIPTAELDAAEDRLANSKASIGELQVAASRSVITAPFAGTLVKVEAERGEVAAPGSPLFRLVQLSPVRVSVALSDRDMGLAREGMPARVELAARAGIYDGKIVQLSQAANLKTRSFEALVEVENEDKSLLPGMIAQVSLTSASSEKGSDAADTLLISQDWLVTRLDGVGVYLEKGGKAVWKPVELGPVVRRQVEVKGGLKSGDRLIIVGHRALADGDAVLVHRTGQCCENGRAVFSE